MEYDAAKPPRKPNNLSTPLGGGETSLYTQ